MEDKVYSFWKDHYRADARAAIEKKEVKNLIARTHYLQPIVEADDLLVYAACERIRPMDGDAFNPIQWWVKKLEDQPTVAQYALDLLCCPVMSAECE
jgi:hAT family C-terminal dimerisation region